MLLAAGEGTRLRPLTFEMPKCLVPINGQPLLDIWLEQLSAVGIDEFLINTHYLADQVCTYLQRSSYQSKVTVVREESLHGTGGSYLSNAQFFENDDVLLAHADNLIQCDWFEFFKAHQCRPAGTVMTMMTFETDQPKSCGIAELNPNGTLKAFHEKVDNPPGKLANGAVFVVTPETLAVAKCVEPELEDFSKELIPILGDRVFTWHNDCYLKDIGTPEAYRVAQADWLALNSKDL